MSKNNVVKFQLGYNNKTTISGKVLKEDKRFVFVKVERVAGKFARASQRNTLCIKKSYIF
jgi:hypothetical protein